MATMTETDTGKRIDDLRAEVHRGFDRVEADVREIKADYRALRSEMKAGFDSVHKMMIRFFAGTLGAIVAGVILFFVTHR